MKTNFQQTLAKTAQQHQQTSRTNLTSKLRSQNETTTTTIATKKQQQQT